MLESRSNVISLFYCLFDVPLLNLISLIVLIPQDTSTDPLPTMSNAINIHCSASFLLPPDATSNIVFSRLSPSPSLQLALADSFLPSYSSSEATHWLASSSLAMRWPHLCTHGSFGSTGGGHFSRPPTCSFFGLFRSFGDGFRTNLKTRMSVRRKRT